MSGPAPRPFPPAWAGLVDDYLAAERGAGRSPATLASRRGHLAYLARGLECPPARVTTAGILGWFGEQRWSIETRRGYRNTCVSFFGWAYRAGHIETNPAAELPVMKAGAPAPRPVPDAVWSAAVDAADPRTRLMLRLAAEAGLRRAEVAQVSTTDLLEGLDGYQLVVHGKGGKVRTLPVSDELGEAIALGAAGHTAGEPRTGYLFPGADSGHLSPRYVGDLVGDVLPAGWTMHKLRHRFATRAYRGSRNLRAVQMLLGHSCVATTERYTAVDDDEIRAAAMAASYWVDK